MAETKIGLIAGSGQFPILFSRAAKKAGRKVYAVCFMDETDPALANHADVVEWLYPGQIGRLARFFRKNGVTQAAMAGAMDKKRRLSAIRPDISAIALLAKLKSTHDDALLRAFADFLAGKGIEILPSTFLVPELLARKGIWTKREPDESETKDISFGFSMARAIGNLDIGQCVVVEAGTVLAVEAVEGTDQTIKRGGSLGRGGAVVVKAAKPVQDRRFDVPAVGIKTIENMAENGCRVLAVEENGAVVFDKEEVIRLADEKSMVVLAVAEGGNTVG